LAAFWTRFRALRRPDGFGAADTQVENYPAAQALFVMDSLSAELIEPIHKEE
jgi:hypothetical protein